jgi:lipopolysaccharide export system protein LptA
MKLGPQRSRLLLPGSLVVGLLGVALGLAVATAQTTVPENHAPDGGGEADESGGLFSGGLLPNGSILKNVVLPSYDEKLRLVSTVNAGDLTIFTRDEPRLDKKTGKPKNVPVLDKVDINHLRIRFFNIDRSPKGNIAMAQARLEIRQKITLLTSDEPVSFVSEDMKVDGSALAFDTKNNRGFLHGPVTAVAKTKDKRTSMNASPAQRALAAGAMMMASAPALPAQEAAPATAPATETSVTTAQRFKNSLLSQEELKQVAAETASRAPQQVAETSAAGKNLADVTAKSEDARLTMNNFLQAAALASMLAEATPAALPDVPRPPAFNDPNETVVKSKNGAYFDSKEGLLIFLGDVTVKNPQLELKGASEVKLFMEPEAEKKKDEAANKPKEGDAAAETPAPPKEAPKELTPEMIEKMRAAKEAQMADNLKKAGKADKGGEGGSFGDIKKMVATGPAVYVRFVSGKPGDKPVEASAHSIVYDFEKQQMILEGGSPWVYQEGGTRAQALGAGAYILIHTDADGNMTKVVTYNPGGFEANLPTPPKKDDNKQQPQKPKQDKPKPVQPNR